MEEKGFSFFFFVCGEIMADKGIIKKYIAFALKYINVPNFDMGGGI